MTVELTPHKPKENRAWIANARRTGGVKRQMARGAGMEMRVARKVSVNSTQSLRGSVPLPETFNPRQTTIQVLDRVGGKLLGMRVMLVS